MTFLSIDSRRTMMTAGLAAFLGFAALAGQGGPTATAGDPLASNTTVTLAAESETQRNEADLTASRSLAANRPLLSQFGAPEAEPVKEAVQEAPKEPAKPAEPTPVAGLDQTQMKNAKHIVDTAKSMGLGKRAQVIAIATAMQESQLRNLASTVYPESYKFTDEGEGSDHDSVGLFQQRPQSGWGTVENLLKPDYATKAFLKALVQVPGWEELPLTRAAQAVQVSAYPDHYAKHEGAATIVVDALQ